MIPIQLTLSGFLSYREPVTIDFNNFKLACIAGSNGAGKSSLLDAITWALFSQARKRDDAVINTRCDTAEVVLIFEYEGNVYRVQRTKQREKTTMLEFHILQRGGDGSERWKPLTERTLRGTEACIEETLRMDYETFINASFFLQGKADQFTQQRPSERKRILGSILGLDVWEEYRKRAWTRRRKIEDEINIIEGRIQECDNELDEEQDRKQNLKRLQIALKDLQEQRKRQEKTLESVRLLAANLERERKLVSDQKHRLDTDVQRLEGLRERAMERQTEKERFGGVLAQALEIEKQHQEWLSVREDLARMDEVAERFREQEKRREEPRQEIRAAQERLLQEQQGLLEQQRKVEAAQDEITQLKERLADLEEKRDVLQTKVERRKQLEEELQQIGLDMARARGENPHLKEEMTQIKERLDNLKVAEGAACPLCGQPLSDSERKSLLHSLEARGKELGDKFRANKTLLDEGEERKQEMERDLASLTEADREIQAHEKEISVVTTQLSSREEQVLEWEQDGSKRLHEVNEVIEKETFAPEARKHLEAVDAELKAIGYDAEAHDSLRKREREGRTSEERVRELDRARSALEPLERELGDLEQQIAVQAEEVARLEVEYREAEKKLAEAEEQAPDLEATERDWIAVQERENILRHEVGAAQQKVEVLKTLKDRKKHLTAQREQQLSQVGQYKQLERAFGKEGVPALLIEQSLPQIESKANEILDRISGGNMSVRFITQAAYKDKSRDDLRETLDIQISDGAGPRDYELFSGGEAFRVNFSVRLALSEVLAQRSGARLQTLVIDEGFGSQDVQGRQRLIEAINLVKPDFEKILVITHIDELKEAFPNRIEVEKTERGSTVWVI